MSPAIAEQAVRCLLDQLAAAGIGPLRLCADSRRVQPGDVFLAFPGHRVDGRRFIQDAVHAGAAAVLWEQQGHQWDEHLQVFNLPVEGLNGLSGYLADALHGHPSADLWIVGVTGTNGKTSVTQWLSRAYGALGRRCGVIGTLGIGYPGKLESSLNTTPDSLTLHRTLADFRDEGAQAVAMEVSSIGLDQGRLNGLHFDVAVLTNLTRDHLDYHGTMESYGAAKARLFDTPGLRSVVLNLDDRFGVEQARRLAGSGLEVIGYTLIPSNAGAASVNRLLLADRLTTTAAGIRFVARCGNESADMHPNVVGQFNVSNLLAVIGTLMASGFTLEEAATVAEDLTPPVGRMQTIGGIGDPLVVVDYAHSPDALEQVLTAVRATVTARNGRLVCVFGCGGDRDPGKRPLMGEVASRLADQVVLTSDNPRTEDPLAILRDVVAGAGAGVEVIADRALAIRQTILAAAADDVIVIAGKGHESYQEIHGVRHPFSDVEQTRAALEAWNDAQGALS
ncbi:UDP-N-acetylmuramoyl-L-alanyl-D-glutamate--2,6-diaminopimelate ligase [Zoogloea sp.]|uniref:UDP-N-acetylmuramoyl-L-alanyl-D-glutamate--2, 6-diaminopimelate ligase n=1 Tax=Zoogloea sp. TaxID=49181 RepID=UPI0026299D2C|nr:UDP-N-acetylmuramoyl-L-alanyl-D-glutamate--2,6-diaminopimelate ligase [Zoogloea sp.]MDD3353098.1 UDP-N-acetylmuramoyl-L-alanyl-D-glutamate--2,6-diaminopimelate ligase [Zoogloea sp.]